MHIRREDTVIVTTGNDSGKKGKVLKIVTKTGRVIVEGVNLRWKNLRKSQKNPQGGRVQRETPLSISNVMVFCNKCNKGVRIRHKQQKDGRSVRSCHKCGQGVGV